MACDLCGKEFSRSSYLKVHQKTHVNKERTFECKTCDKKYRQSVSLKRHQKIHEIENPFECKYCTKSFAQASILNKHIQKHENTEEKYQCTVCEKKFTLKFT